MKVCVSLRDKTGTNLRADNLRSEPRWERLALEACTVNPEVTEIYTLGYEWPNGQNISNKYKGMLIESSPQDCILLLQDWNNDIINRHPFKAAIINIFHGPWLTQKNEITKAMYKLNGNLFFTIGHPVLYDEEVRLYDFLPDHAFSKISRCAEYHLGHFITKDKLCFLPLPWIPKSEFKDRFSNNNLIYEWRLVYFQQLYDSMFIEWAFNKMNKNKKLNLHILTGWLDNEPKDYVNNDVIYIKQDLNEYFWGLDKFNGYSHLKNRVKIHCTMSWDDVLVEYSKARLLITHAVHYGGPSMQASMYGVPFIGKAKVGAIANCKQYLQTKNEERACKLLDKLISNRKYYKKIATAYNRYAVNTYSFDSFNKNLNKILRKRNLL